MPPVGLLVVSLVVQPTGSIGHRLIYFATFFFAGAWVARRGPAALERITGTRWLVVFAGPAMALGVLSTRVEVAYLGVFVPGSIMGVLVAIGVARTIPDRWTRAVRYVGRHSIVYYVAHFPFMVGALWLLQGTGTLSPLVIVALLAVGIGVGTGLAHVRERSAVRWLFEMPFVLRPPRLPLVART